jgi:hypothetical protein
LNFAPFDNFTLGLDISQNLSYYISDKLEYVWAGDLFDRSKHPFTAALQAKRLSANLWFERAKEDDNRINSILRVPLCAGYPALVVNILPFPFCFYPLI